MSDESKATESVWANLRDHKTWSAERLAQRRESLRRLRDRIRQRHAQQSDSTLLIREDRDHR